MVSKCTDEPDDFTPAVACHDEGFRYFWRVLKMIDKLIAKSCSSVSSSFSTQYRHFWSLSLLVVGLSCYAPSSGAAAPETASNNSPAWLNLEIAGISLSTAPEKISEKLAAQGYVQSGEHTFLKETPLAGGRKTLYRVEVEDNTTQRSITYTRTESGGRVKSPIARSRIIPEDELVWVRPLYAAVCEQVQEAVRQVRACRPPEAGDIGFSQSALVKVSDQVEAMLDASGPNTAAKIIQRKQ